MEKEKWREFQEKEHKLWTVRPNKEKKGRDEIGLEKRRFRERKEERLRKRKKSGTEAKRKGKGGTQLAMHPLEKEA